MRLNFQMCNPICTSVSGTFSRKISKQTIALTLIKSISGIRGTIGGLPGKGLTPQDVVKFATAYARWMKKEKKTKKVVVGRDARISGDMVNHLVIGALLGNGIDVVDIGLSTTPTVEMAVAMEEAGGGIVITASHNPKQWNALKLLNEKGEFISGKDGEEVLKLAKKSRQMFPEVDEIGKLRKEDGFIQKHIDTILALPLVDVEAIKKRGFKIAIDCVNSTGGIAVPMLLKALGVTEIVELNCEPDGNFAHNPEPLPENLVGLSQEVTRANADLGICVDPDVDRLALVCEDGSMFGEEYTLVAVADYVLKHNKGNTVSNLSSSRALNDVTQKRGGKYFASAVGEVNVVQKMKEVSAVIGGEGNGGVIYPELHYGRDALVGIALFLTHLATSGKSCAVLRSTYPDYFMSKNKVTVEPEVELDDLLGKLQDKYKKQPLTTIDGLKIEFEKDWVLLRRSNTEPIIRIYSESLSENMAQNMANQIIDDLKYFLNSSEN